MIDLIVDSDVASVTWDGTTTPGRRGGITRTFLSNELHDRFHDACGAIGLPHPGA